MPVSSRLDMFINLWFHKGFRDYNFSDFYAQATAGGPIERCSEDYIENQLREPDEPEPYFFDLVRFTLSEPCCQGFLRQTDQPATARDYYLSKLFQFIYQRFKVRYGLADSEWDARDQLQESLNRLPDALFVPGSPTAPEDLFFEVYWATHDFDLNRALRFARERFDWVVRTGDAPHGRPAPSKPGRPGLPAKSKEDALEARKSGKSLRECAKILYDVRYPTQQQIKAVPAILKHFERRLTVKPPA